MVESRSRENNKRNASAPGSLPLVGSPETEKGHPFGAPPVLLALTSERISVGSSYHWSAPACQNTFRARAVRLGLNPLKKGNKMAFNSREYSFNLPTLTTVNEVGAVYGLFRPTPNRPGFYTCLYVGQTNNLRTRLYEHYNNPPVAGVTHFFAEVVTTEQQRRLRERQLVGEFSPVGNKTRGG
jgi:hypothetical protein